VLADVEGLSAPEIADALGCKLNTVYSRLRRARDAVVRAMAELDRRPLEDWSPIDAGRLGARRVDHG